MKYFNQVLNSNANDVMTIFYILWASIKSRYISNNKYGSYDVKPNYNRLENCLLCVGQVSTSSKIYFDVMICNLLENCIPL